ncbi:hypothetical protein SESBI_32698 [Sesbania bispinosa]|nr:hypothetical protein SESBI_32697 [Sesbania bispinosa]KAJ1396308.1 hypothetical protein SESBI_32698 [Sesbania bispinosa]
MIHQIKSENRRENRAPFLAVTVKNSIHSLSSQARSSSTAAPPPLPSTSLLPPFTPAWPEVVPSQWLAALEMGRVGAATMTLTEAMIVEGATRRNEIFKKKKLLQPGYLLLQVI